MDGSASGSFRDAMAHDSARSTTPRDSPSFSSTTRSNPAVLPGFSPLNSISPQRFGSAVDDVSSAQRSQVQKDFFANKKQDLEDYLLMALNTIATIEPHQSRYRNEFISYTSSIRSGQTTTRKSRSVAYRYQENPEANQEYIFFIGKYTQDDDCSGTTFIPGYHAMNLSAAAAFLINFLARYRCDAEKYLSLLDIPRAIIRPLLEPALRTRFGAFCDQFVSHIIHPASLDCIHWWRLDGILYCEQIFWPDSHVQATLDDEQVLDKTAEGTLFSGDVSRVKEMQRQSGAFEGTDPDSLYAYKDALEQAAENIPASVRYRPGLAHEVNNAAMHVPETIPPEDRNEENLPIRPGLDPHRLSFTCYLYLAYAMAHPWVGAPRSVANRIVVSSPPPFRTAPYKGIDFGIVFPPPETGNYKYTIAQLYPVLMAFVTGTQLDPVRRATVGMYMQDSGAVLLRLSELATDIVLLLVHEHLPKDDLLASNKKLLLERLYARSEGLDRWSRVFRAACKRTFSHTGPRDNRRQLNVAVERQVLGSFLHDLEAQACPLEQDRVHRWLAEGTGINVDTMLWADAIFRPPVLDGNELHQRAQKVLAHIQEADKTIIVIRFPPKVSIVEVQTSVDYYCSLKDSEKLDTEEILVGNDHKGVYMLIEYHHYCILLQIMLNVTTTTVGFRHNIPLFPLLCRLYFSRIRPYSVIDLDTPHPLTSDTNETPLVRHTNDHALHTFVTILGHWLGIATRAPSDTCGPIAPSVEHQEEAVDRVYIPGIDHKAFGCLRLLHRFMALMESTTGVSIHTMDKVDDITAEAVGGFLEMLRPRSMPFHLVKQLISILEPTRPSVCDTLQTTAKGCNDEEDRVIVTVPWIIYSAMLEDLLPRPIVQQLLTQSAYHFAPVGRTVLSTKDLRHSCLIEEETSEMVRKTRQYTAAYNRMFVVPFMPSERVMAGEFQTEPVSPLAHFVRVLEASVAPTSLAIALGRDGVPEMDPECTGVFRDALSRTCPPFEEAPVEFLVRVYDFARMLRGQHLTPDGMNHIPEDMQQWRELNRKRRLEEEASTSDDDCATHTSSEECWNFDTMVSTDCKSMLPLQFWPGDHNDEQRHNIIYYEKFFSIVSFLGGTYAAHLEDKGLDQSVITREAYSSDYKPHRVDKVTPVTDQHPFYYVPRYLSHHLVRQRMVSLSNSIYNTSDTLFCSAAQLKRVFSDPVCFKSLRALQAHLIQRLHVPANAPPQSVRTSLVIPGQVCLAPIQISLAHLPPHFESYDDMCRYVSLRLNEPLPGETQPDYVRRMQLNRQNTCERSRALFSALARLYQSCGLRDFRTDDRQHPESAAFNLHTGSEPITLEALTGAWIFLLDEIVKRGVLRAARKRSRGTQSPLPH